MNTEKNIVIIDDDPIIHMSFEMMLFGSRYKQTSIVNPSEVMLRLKSNQNKPDLILVDFMMGKISGIEVIRLIRADSYFKQTPVILFTGYHEKIAQEIELLKDLNIACVLPKPLSKMQLLSRLDVLLGT